MFVTKEHILEKGEPTENDPIIASFVGAIAGGLISFITAHQQHRIQLEVLQRQRQTEFIAEETVGHFLRLEMRTERSLEVIKGHVGGFNDDDLPRILIMASAIRVYGDDGSELWSLLERQDEKIRGEGKVGNMTFEVGTR